MFATSIAASASSTTSGAGASGRMGGRARRIVVAGAAIAVAVVFSGCSSGDDSAAKTTTTTVAGAGVAASSTTIAAGNTNTANDNSGGNGQSSSGTAPSGPAPTIATFVTPENIDCHNGNQQNFSASWTTTNAVKTTISIDGPGVYKTYGANGSDSLPFNCSSSHSFLLTAYGQDGRTATKTITLQPRNVQAPTTDSAPGSTTTT